MSDYGMRRRKTGTTPTGENAETTTKTAWRIHKAWGYVVACALGVTLGSAAVAIASNTSLERDGLAMAKQFDDEIGKMEHLIVSLQADNCADTAYRRAMIDTMWPAVAALQEDMVAMSEKMARQERGRLHNASAIAAVNTMVGKKSFPTWQEALRGRSKDLKRAVRVREGYRALPVHLEAPL